MSKLPEKLRIFKTVKRLKYEQIANETGAQVQTVKNWCSENLCPKVIRRDYAEALVKFSNGKITLKDCGHKQ